MATTSETSNRKLNRLYRHRDGEINKKQGPTVVAVILEPIGGTGRVTAELAELFPAGLPEPCLGLAATAFGLNTVLGNEIAGKTGTADELLEAISERWSVIQDGEWSEGRQGPRVKFVLEAWAANAARLGREVQESHIDAMRKKLESGDVTTAQLLSDAGIRTEYDGAEAQRKVAKFKASQEARDKAGAASPSTAFLPE